MHYYKHNIADYRKDTSHLSVLEHGIYRQLMDQYYLDEKPIKTQSVIRRLRLVSDLEQNALQNVLNDFFEFDEQCDSWIHTRINREISEYHEKSAKNKANGSKGGRPKKPKKTQSVKNANQMESESKGNSLTYKPLTQELINKYFVCFWSAGLVKLNKQNALKSFGKVLNFQVQQNNADPEEFTNQLVSDIKKRIEVKQLGIDNMHPTTYLNNARWEDEIPDPPTEPHAKTASIFDLSGQNYESGAI